jgi:hypothetical protein
MLKRFLVALALVAFGTAAHANAVVRRRNYLCHAGRMVQLLFASIVACSMSIGAAAAATTTTTLVTSDQATAYGQQFTLTATVTPSGGGVATGTVTFTNASSNVVLGSAALNESGQASLNIVSPLFLGTHALMAEYAGNGDLGASTSPFVFQVVARADTTTTFATSTKADPLCPTVTFTVTVTSNAPGSGTPGGSVTFKSNGYDIFRKSFPLVNGKVVLPTDSLAGEGVHMLTATYSGGGGYNGSVSPVTPHSVSNGPRSQVNTYTTADQDRSSVAALTGGGFVVTWISTNY